MKRFFAILAAAVMVFALAGCGEMSLQIAGAESILLRSGNTGKLVEVTSPDDVAYITDNLSSMKFEKGSSSKKYSGWTYWIKWCDADGKVIDQVVLMGDGYTVDYDDFFWRGMVADNEIDIEYLDILSEKLPSAE
ncbi:MAG: hypothetical protein IJP23_04725 [Oscillospiraceae bacterium]|nr:hypothetical protein [Oscillospiraceae bacterium]